MAPLAPLTPLPLRPRDAPQADSHLYTQGKEQKEPIEVDDATNTYNTKSEAKLTEYEALIVDVHTLMREAADATAGRKAAQAAEQSVHAAQDAAAKAAYKTLSPEELEVCSCM